MENDRVKVIFAKATVYDFCAIVAYKDKSVLKVCEIVESENISDFINELIELAKKHNAELVNYECSVYLAECSMLRCKLAEENIKVRGYESDGRLAARIVSQAEWIRDNVLVNEKYSDFIDRMTSFNPAADDRNIAMDVLSDAASFFRRYYFR